MDELNSVIHQPARLQIMSALAQLRAGERVDFTFLKERLGLTDGNLGAHLATLELSLYVEIQKEFVGRKPKTFLSITEAGRVAFARHVEALEKIIKPPSV